MCAEFHPKKPTKRQKLYISRRFRYMYMYIYIYTQYIIYMLLDIRYDRYNLFELDGDNVLLVFWYPGSSKCWKKREIWKIKNNNKQKNTKKNRHDRTTGQKNLYMDVSKNRGTPKSSILIGISIINHPFWGTPIFGNTHIKETGSPRIYPCAIKAFSLLVWKTVFTGSPSPLNRSAINQSSLKRNPIRNVPWKKKKKQQQQQQQQQQEEEEEEAKNNIPKYPSSGVTRWIFRWKLVH